jgi:hypothetical protein
LARAGAAPTPLAMAHAAPSSHWRRLKLGPQPAE